MAFELRHTDKIAATIFILFSLAVFFYSATLPDTPMPTGPGTYPQIVTGLIAIFATIQLIKSIRNEDVSSHEISKPVVKRVTTVTVLLVTYLVTLPYFGFLIGTALFLGVTMRYSGVTSKRHLISLSILIPIALHYVFGQFLRVRLPENILLPISRLLPRLPLTAGGFI